ncbi:tetratricopeptide repeat protein [Oleiharenicola lentus]|uniref:tetratricopeptide repeat protein n=1 Tax=Oleiharenicola lentus TaxID=2508720 RepID=UPI003F678FCA
MKTKSILLAACAAFFTTLTFAQTPAEPTDAAALNKLSLESGQQKKTKEAIDYAEKATKADPTKPEYFSQLGIALANRMNEVNFMQMAALSGKMKKAFEKSIELDPKHVPGLIGLARFYVNAPEIAGGSTAKAKTYAERIKAIDPLLGEVELGRIAEKDENFAEALRHYDAALTLKPDSSGMQFASGRMFLKLGKKEDARIAFQAALKLKPDHDGAKQALATLDTPVAK